MNNMKQCLFCYEPILEIEATDFHEKCSKKLFGTKLPPVLPYAESEMEALANEIVKSQFTITGVQAKISLNISADSITTFKKFTIVGLWGNYILKLPSNKYKALPEVEDLSMHLASIAKINTVPHSLIRMQDDSLAYITKRIDRNKKSKVAMEDMCQITERLTEHKYQSSYEQIAKAILKYSKQPVLDVINFYEQVLFSFIIGNADMHLKNFSLIDKEGLGHVLSPAYDMVSTVLVNPDDKEELALNLNGKKKKIKLIDFIAAFEKSGLDTKQQNAIFSKMNNSCEKWFLQIDKSFIGLEYKTALKEYIKSKLAIINN